MGPACSAKDTTTDRPVIVQLANVTFPTQAVEKRLRERAERPSEIPSVANAIVADEDPEHGWFIVWDLAEGETLSEILARTERLTGATAHAIGVALLEAIAALHKTGQTHFGLAPANVWLEASGITGSSAMVVRLIGLGLYDPVPSSQSGIPHQTIWRYLAPEQLGPRAVAESVGQAADNYACAVMLYQLLSGQLPHSAKGMRSEIEAKTKTSPRPLSEAIGHRLPEAIETFFMAALSTDPQQRIPSSLQMLDAWNAFADKLDLAPVSDNLDEVLRARQIEALNVLLGQLSNGGSPLPSDLFGTLLEEVSRRADERLANDAWDDAQTEVTQIRELPKGSESQEILEAARRDLLALSPGEQTSVMALLASLVTNPAPRGAEPLNDSRRHVRLYHGDLRVLYCVRGGIVVLVRVLRGKALHNNELTPP